jgi:hypothetical protein
MESNPEQPLSKRQIAGGEHGTKSNGQVAKEGKEKSRFNFLEHGLSASKQAFMKDEDREGFEALRLALYEEYDPQPGTEILILERVVTYAWRLRRLLRMEKEILESSPAPKLSELNHLARYETSLQRSMNQLIKFLEQQRKLRMQQTRFLEVNQELDTPPRPLKQQAIIQSIESITSEDLTENLNRLWENSCQDPD